MLGAGRPPDATPPAEGQEHVEVTGETDDAELYSPGLAGRRSGMKPLGLGDGAWLRSTERG